MLRAVKWLAALLITQAGWTYDAIEPRLAELREVPIRHAADLSSSEAFERWRPTGERVIRALLQVPSTTVAPDVRRLGLEQLDGYRREKIDYLVEPGLRIPAFLFVPDGRTGPGPAVVLWHGHSHGGKNALAGIAPQTAQADLHQAAAVKAVQAGLVVLAPDIRMFGETGSWYDHQRLSGSMLLFGKVALGLFVADAIRAVDVLGAEVTVDPDRIGTGGMSLGGEIALFLGALDHRVRAVVVQGFLSSFRGTLMNRVHDICQYVPGLGVEIDFADVAMLIAPRPLLFVIGRRDPVFPLNDANRAYFSIRRGFELVGAPSSVLLHRHGGAHSWHSPPAIDWWLARLKARGDQRPTAMPTSSHSAD